MKNFLLLLACLSLSLAVHGQTVYKPDPDGVLYVNADANENPADYNWIGDNWQKAISQLSDAMRAADSLNTLAPGTVTQIWVAKGIYKPLYSAEDGRHREDGSRKNAFLLLKDVKIYGGFSGVESTLGQRDTAKLFSENTTTLSGDLGIAGDAGDNAFHVIVAAGQTGRAELNGFVIADGNANLSAVQVKINNQLIDNNRGGGFCSLDAEAIMANCLFTHNNAAYLGGGIFVSHGKLTISNCHFNQNQSENGGALYNSGAQTSMRNCYFSENNATNGGGAFIEGAFNFDIEKCTFSGNKASYGGGGLYDSSAGPAITGCFFTGNHASKGGALYNVESSEPVVTNSAFSANVAENWGGGAYDNHSYPNYVGCLFAGNKAVYGGAVCSDNNSGEGMMNCTIAGNLATAADGGGAIRIYNASPTVFNTIIWGNSTGISAGMNAAPTINYTIVQSDHYAGSNHNLFKDPMFVRPVSFSGAPGTGGDYRLKTGSPAVDYGTGQLPDYLTPPDTDLAGNTRLAGLKFDLGAYEFLQHVPDNHGIFYVNKNVSGGNGSGDSWQNAFKELSDALLLATQINGARPGTVKEIWVAKGTYSPLYSAEDGKRTQNSDTKHNYIDNVYVSANAFVLPGEVKIYGGFAGTETSPEQRGDASRIFHDQATILDGNNTSCHVVIAANVDSVVLDGFVIQRGMAAGGVNSFKIITVNGSSIEGISGGGMYGVHASVSLANCLFKDNRAPGILGGSGGGVYLSGSFMTMSSCRFSGNHATFLGGAMHLEDMNAGVPGTIANCTFDGNYTTQNGSSGFPSGGGAIYNLEASALRMDQCIFKNNYAYNDQYSYGGALLTKNASPEISRCVFSDNHAGYGGAMYNIQSSPDIAGCSFIHNKAMYQFASEEVGNGGSIYNNVSSSPNIFNSIFKNNQANGDGGAIMNFEQSSPLIAGCLFSGNEVLTPSVTQGQLYYHGGDIYSGANSDPVLVNCTIIAKDYPNALQNNNTVMSINNSETVIMNSIIWGGDNIQLAWDDATSKITATYSVIWQPNSVKFDGEGNLNRDPLFISGKDSNYHLRENSPAVGTGTNNIARYHLPDMDMDGNPRVADGKINMGAYASTFVHPTALTAIYDGRDTVNISWEAPLQADESYVGGDNFKLERSADSTFEGTVKTVTANIKYEPDEKVYQVQDDITDMSGGTRLFYRLTRTMAQNQDWEMPARASVDVTIITQLIGDSAVLVSKTGEAPKAGVYWKPFVGVWVQGTQFNLIKKNMTDGTQQSIAINEDAARAGHYIDDNIPTCKEIRYAISVKLGNHYASPADESIADSILTKELATLEGLTASKGYYPDRTTLRWSTTGSYDHYVINRKVYGSSGDFVQVNTIEGAGLKDLQATDDDGTPGVYYQYAVTGLAQCSSISLHSDTIQAIGFRSPTGTVYGRVTYEKGGGAVRNAEVRMGSQDDTRLGKSVYLDGQAGSRLVLDSMPAKLVDSAFTISLWIKPDDKQPKNQIIFSHEGQYELGFNGQGELYFRYNGEEITGAYLRDTANGYVHIAAMHNKDSLLLMLGDSVLSGKTIDYKPVVYASDRAYIGSNSDGGYFKGFIDEMRLWNVARDPAQIARDYTRLLTGGETGLIAYWRFDETIKDQFYDLSHQDDSYHGNDGRMDPRHVQHSDVIPTADQLSLKAFTDSTGNYIIAGIPYAGINGTTYAIAPKLGSHVFDPVAVTRIFSSGSSNFTVDFTDKSSYIVSGYVTYSGTTVPVKGVQFKIDDQFAFNGTGGVIQTGDDGSFEISVPVGIHEVKAVKPNHVFENGGRMVDANGENINFQQSWANVQVHDSTRVRFIGRVAGGAVQAAYPVGFSLSKNNLGSVIKIALELQSSANYRFIPDDEKQIQKYYRHILYTDSAGVGRVLLPDSTKVDYTPYEITIYPDSATGEFAAELIPADFKITAVTVQGSNYGQILNGSLELNLTDSVAERTLTHERMDSVYDAASNQWGNYTTYHDTVKYNASYIFPVRKSPVISVKQSMNPNNPNTVDYFGDSTSVFTTMDGSKSIIPLYDKITGHYTFDHPVFRQNVLYGMKITSFEQYPYFYANGSIRDTDFVPSQGGIVQITNDLKNSSATPDTAHIGSNGIAFYSFYPGTPELTDGKGLKGFSVSVQIGSQVYQWNNGNRYAAYVFGGKQTGTDFVTTGPNQMIGILRDPPGSGSYSFLEKGSSITTSSTLTGQQVQFGNEQLTLMLGFESEILSGAPTFLVGSTIKVENENTLNFSHEEHQTSENTISSTTTFNSGYQTSSDPQFDGALDDLFIGKATNITYGTSLLLQAVPNDKVQTADEPYFKGKDFSIVKRVGLHLGQKFKTLFVYPQDFIESTLIPNLKKIRNGILSQGSALSDPQATANATHAEIYVSKVSDPDDPTYGSRNTDKEVWGNLAAVPDQFADGSSYKIYFPQLTKEGKNFKEFGQAVDTINQIDQEIDQWVSWLKQNEKDKVTATYSDNFSFGGGANIDQSAQTTTSMSRTDSYQFVLSGSVLISLGVSVDGNGVLGSVEEGYSQENTTENSNATEATKTVGYHLEEDGSDYMSVDVGNDDQGFNVFRIKGGATSCPYEGGTVTRYYNPGSALNQPTVQTEVPEISVEKPVVTGVSANRPASYTIYLQNASSVKQDTYFGMSVIDKSNPYGAKIYMDGYPLGAGRNVLIPAGEKLAKTLTLEKGPDSMNYDNIQVVLYSTCQYDPSSYSNNIADTISISARFLPACSDVHLSSPTDQWLLNTGSPLNQDGEPYLPVTLDQYDLHKNLFSHIALQYKAATSSDWTTVMKFYTDSAAYQSDPSGGARQIIPSPDKIDYDLVMDPVNFTDGRYDIRALSVCMDNGQEIARTPSNVASGIKDTYTPRLFGNPQPANGILGIGDDVRLNFNEPLDIGFLNHNNFTVQAVKNGSALDSLVSIQLDGIKDYAETEFDKNIAGKDITISLWMMPDGQQDGTLFSQGNKNESLELSLTADGYLQAVIGSKILKSDKPVTPLPGQWVHVALEYRAADSTVSVFYNFDKVIKEAKTGRYAGTGPFVFGKSLKNDGRFFAGKMRNLRIWTETLSSIQLQQNSAILLSGGENHLLACYPMSEGEGKVLFDKAHGNNAAFTGEWKTPEGRSVTLAGKGYVRLNTSQAVITPEMDFTLGLWFKGTPEQTTATLISNGKGDGTDLGSSENLYALGFENGLLTFNNNSLKVQAEGDYLDNNWHHVVITANRNTGTAQMYVDGQLKKFFDAGNLGGMASTFTYLGARAYHQAEDSTITHFDRYFTGNIDEVSLWNTYLGSTLVSKNNNVKLTGKETGLLAYYPFEIHVNTNGIWSTGFTDRDQKVQADPLNHIPDAVLVSAAESSEKAPMKDAGPKVDLPYDFVANNDAIVFNFTGGPEEMKAIDKTIVTFTAKDIKDQHGNFMASPVTWTAYIDQNPLGWSDDELNLTKAVNKTMQFESYIVNNGGSEENFQLGNLPPWLTADVTAGTVPPEGKQKITFTVNAGLNVGAYDDIIEMTNDLHESQGLMLNLKVTGQAPDWKINPEDFRYNMTIYGKIRIDGIFSDNPDDMLAAFHQGQCVGVVHNTYFREGDLWYAFLTVYSDSLQMKGLEFRIWDADNGKVYVGVPDRGNIDFSNGSIIGTPRSPVIFDGRELIFQNIPLLKGWNWISFNVRGENFNDINTTLINGQWQSGDIVKLNSAGFANYSGRESAWVGGNLHAFTNESSYMLKTANAQALSIGGTAVDLKATAIPVRGGQWNYISYLPQNNMTVKDALAGYLAYDGDVIKSQTGFAMYDSRLGWVGNLEYMQPGKGYMLFRTGTSDTAFHYPVLAGVLHRDGSILRLNPDESPVAGNFRYADNMTVLAAVSKDFTMLPGDKVLAYGASGLRGEALAINNPVSGTPSFFFNVSGDERQPIHFEVERGGKIVAQTDPVIAYRSNRMIGNLQSPFMLHFDASAIQAKVFPNPFHTQVEIKAVLKPGRHEIQMAIYDASGKLILKSAKETIDAKYYHAVWDGKDRHGMTCGNGIYFIHLKIDGRSYVYKVVKY